MNITNIPIPTSAFIDARTGLMAREWYRFFLNLFTLTGGGQSDISVSDLAKSPAEQDPLSAAPNLGPDTQLAAMMSRYDTLQSAVQGAYLEPAEPESAAQLDPLAYCAPAPVPTFVVPAPLTKVDDTNVTLTLSGLPTIALLAPTEIKAGWSGTLAKARGGSGQGTYEVALLNAALTPNVIPIATTDGRLTDGPTPAMDGTYAAPTSITIAAGLITAIS